MSTKPASVARWAETSPGVASGPITVPTSGKKDAGFAGGERGAAQYFDWLFAIAYEWQQYLSDGAMSGAFTFDSTIDCTTGYRGAAGTIALFPVDAKGVNVFKYTTATQRPIDLGTAFDTVGATCSIAVHTRTGLDKITFIASAVPVYLPIRGLSVGDIITGAIADLTKGTNAGLTVTIEIAYWTGAGEVAALADTVNGVPASYALTTAAGTVVVASGRRYYVKITPSGSVTAAADVIKDCYVLWKNA